MVEETLESTITRAIVTERQHLLEAKIEDLRKRHAAEVGVAVDKALAAIRGKDAAKPKARKPRKPRADKGTKRMGRGLPKVPNETEPEGPEL